MNFYLQGLDGVDCVCRLYEVGRTKQLGDEVTFILHFKIYFIKCIFQGSSVLL